MGSWFAAGFSGINSMVSEQTSRLASDTRFDKIDDAARDFYFRKDIDIIDVLLSLLAGSSSPGLGESAMTSWSVYSSVDSTNRISKTPTLHQKPKS